MLIEKAANGGYVVEHQFDNENAGESYRRPEKHALADSDALAAHVTKHTSPASQAAAEADAADRAEYQKFVKKRLDAPPTTMPGPMGFGREDLGRGRIPSFDEWRNPEKYKADGTKKPTDIQLPAEGKTKKGR